MTGDPTSVACFYDFRDSLIEDLISHVTRSVYTTCITRIMYLYPKLGIRSTRHVTSNDPVFWQMSDLHRLIEVCVHIVHICVSRENNKNGENWRDRAVVQFTGTHLSWVSEI